MLPIRAIPPAFLLICLLGCEGGSDLVVRVLDHPTPSTLEEVPYQRVDLPELIAHPERFVSKGVILRCRYHGAASFYTPAYTDFTEPGYINFAVWAPAAPLWEPEGFSADHPFFYVFRRRRTLVEDFREIRPFDLIEVKALVASSFGGRPYLRVDHLRRRGGVRVTLEGLQGIHAAVTASRTGRWTEGVALARRALSGKLPLGAEPALRRALGRCLLESGNPRQALPELAEASRAFPEDTELLKWEARCAQLLAGMGKGRPAEAIRFLEDAQAKAPEDPEIPRLLAEALLAAGHPEEALAAAGRAVGLSPGNPDAHLELAALKAGQGQLDGAVQSYRNALSLDPGCWKAWAALARVQIRRGNLEEAVAGFEQAFLKGGSEAAPDDRYLAGRCLQSLGRGAQARQAFEAALAQPGAWEGVADAQAALGELALVEKDFAAAAMAYEAALAAKPRDPELLACLGVARMKGGDPSAARKAFEDALSEDVPRPAMVGEELARACLAQGDLKAASRAIDAACRKEDASARRFLQGRIARLRGELKVAERAFARCCELDPQDLQAHLARAEALIELDRCPKALETLSEAEKLSSENAGLLTLRALAVLREGKAVEPALPAAEKALALAPQDPRTRHVYGWALLANSRAADAVPVLREIAGEIPEVRFHLAQSLVQAGEAEEARPLLEELAKGASDFSRRARKLLKSLPKRP